ncbi:Isoleucyl-tRNA synthetase [Stigmatella aurantiaca DW4/3-1]|uniref:isoleucine--tRNA ligase n=2 Tax=Stigmatella aurantiaca TaxID=41 RepID=E3FT74_STIAD|nr:Isoleucyl-tRNA synthetase [Stigmatella aurantiaca DW4/3-1]
MSDAGMPPSDFQDPQTLARRESQRLAWWAERGIWARLQEKNAAAAPFVVAGGPVDAQPVLSVDAASTRILQDVVAKFRHLSGRRCDVLPGWSVHGLALERAVEQRLQEENADRQALSPEGFLERCRAYVRECNGLQEAELQRWGVWGGGAPPFWTLEASFAARELRELAALARQGGLTRLQKPAFWCPRDQTVLGEEEVEDAPRQSPSLYMAFRAGPELAERLPMLAGREVFFLVWTSAPWMLPANQSLSVNGDFEYVFYQLGERVICAARTLLAKALAEVKGDELVKKTAHLRGGDVETVGFEDPRRILAYASGEDLEHLTYQHPWLERTGRVVLSPQVTDEVGTGCVLTPPEPGAQGVDLSSAVREDGRSVELLAERGALLNEKTDTVEHPVPHCRFCHQPVLHQPLDQWCIPMDRALEGGKTPRELALEAVDRVRWLPEEAHGRIRRALEGQKERGLGRQRRWGVPLPVAFCEGCDEALALPEAMERVADAVEKEGVGVWFRTPVEAFLGPDVRCARCGGSAFRRGTEVLDARFDAACMFPAVLERWQRRAADLCLEGVAPHGGWFLASLQVGAGIRAQALALACLTHGPEVSPGRVFPVETLRQQYGAEVLRLWVATPRRSSGSAPAGRRPSGGEPGPCAGAEHPARRAEPSGRLRP